MVEYAKRKLKRLKKAQVKLKLQRNDKDWVTTRDLRNDTMRKKEQLVAMQTGKTNSERKIKLRNNS